MDDYTASNAALSLTTVNGNAAVTFTETGTVVILTGLSFNTVQANVTQIFEIT